jgi:hypothetical protein
MIKINLVTRKQLANSKSGSGSGNNDFQSLISGALAGFKSDARLDGLKELPLRKIALAILTCVSASYLLDSYKEDEIAKVETLITRARDDQGKIKIQLAKTKGFDEVKAALDADEQTLRIKIDTISKLLEALKDPPKMMKSLSAAIPQDVWLKSLKIGDKDVELKGQSFGFSLISDFMKALNESAYFTDLKLVGTQKDSDGGPDVVAFELEAKKR